MKSIPWKTKKPWQERLAPLLLVLLIFGVLNAGYLWAHIRFTFSSVFGTTETNAHEIVFPQIERLEPDLLRIDRMGIAAPIQYVATSTEAVFQEALMDGVVHYPGTALPGEFGNVYIFGHSSDYRWSKGSYKTVFALLTKIKTGDDILITNHEGIPFHYIVNGTSIVSPTDVHVLDQQGNTKKLLTLQTSYPLGTALKRLIVTAEMATSSATP
jgi:LPXTG-site transpeptidase (sortase) family protein